MPELGELSIDLSFEDLEFINEGLEDENTPGEGEGKDTKGEGEGAGEDTAAEGSEEEKQKAAKEAKDNDDAAEGDDPDKVSGEATEGKGDGEQTSPQLYHTLASVLKEKGVLTSVDESSLKDIKDVEGFVELMKGQIKAQEFNDLTDTQKNILKGIREGAKTTTVDRFESAMTKLNDIDDKQIEGSEDVQKDLIYQDYLSKGFSKENAIKQVNRSVQLKETLADAKESYQNLKTTVQSNYDKAKQADIDLADSDAKKVDKDKKSLEKAILGSNAVIKGYDVPENTRKEVYSEMMKHVSVNPDNKKPENSLMKFQRESPEEFTHKLYYLWTMSNGFKDLEYFSGKKTSSSVKDLESAIKNSTHVQGGGEATFSDDINAGLLNIEDIVVPDE